MNNLSTSQLLHLSLDELESLTVSLYEKFDQLKKDSTVIVYGEVPKTNGIKFNYEIINIRSYIKCIERVIDKKITLDS
jgi:hypothetical protein